MKDKDVEVIEVPEGTSTSLKLALNEALSGGDSLQVKEEEHGETDDEADDEQEVNNQTDGEEDEVESILTGISKRAEEEQDLTEGIDEEEVSTEERVQRESLFFLELEDITRNGSFRPNKKDRQFPIIASGQIDSIYILAQDNTFTAYLEVDNQKVLDSKSWSTINSDSQELSHIGAYQRQDGNYVLSIADYPFNERLDFSITPTDQTTFNTIRVEVMVDEFTRGPE